MKNQYGMIFFSKNLNYQPDDISALIYGFQKEGFIGDSFVISPQTEEPTGYLIGDEFLKLITFLGCSPHIEVTPPEQLTDWGNFCYIELQSFQEPRFYKGLNQLKCSCPSCKSRVTKNLPNLDQWAPESQQVICSKCQQTTLPEDLNWRHGAGFGQFFIRVNSIYPNEAVPTEKLMGLLKFITNENWDYFYFEQ